MQERGENATEYIAEHYGTQQIHGHWQLSILSLISQDGGERKRARLFSLDAAGVHYANCQSRVISELVLSFPWSSSSLSRLICLGPRPDTACLTPGSS